MTIQDLEQIDGLLTKRLDQRFLTFTKEIIEKIEESKMEILELVDKHKADKEDLKVLEHRVDVLEKELVIPLSQ